MKGTSNSKLQHLYIESAQNLPHFAKPSSEPGSSVPYLFWTLHIYSQTNGPGKVFAQDVIEEVAAFPHGQYDDYVDSMTQALMRIRQGGLIRHPEDAKDEPIPKKRVEYYG